ncbi:histidine triad (HIT) protein [Bacterioplanes sanyensis]|uniref:HIT domain-containing protein n=1 Tax=Bacterioplanes sanyensis TaxID=1249553 RepID=UPI001673F6FB|nr:HIT domain-containing protein [Bacterioplanes sanyensis]GGY35254.1 histidine triad (HIT) protein [Bacterioplanes sanyensis]
MFRLDERLQADTAWVGRLPLCQVLLMNDVRYPWVILVPVRTDVFEVYHLSEQDRIQLAKESALVTEKLADHFAARSMNIGALGNIVPQLHVHHVVRKEDDPAWPAPVWGHSAPQPYDAELLEQRVAELKSLLGSHFVEDVEAADDAANNVYW